MKLLFLALILFTGLALGVTFAIKKQEIGTDNKITMPVKFSVKDFPEHGVFLIVPSNPSFAEMEAKLAKPKPTSIGDSYSVFLKNNGQRTIVGYSIKWECVDSSGEVIEKDVSNIISWIFLHGEESDHRKALARAKEIIRPNAIWFIPFNAPARPLEGNGDAFDTMESSITDEADTIKGCRSVTVIADGIFFDDGTFIGPDTTNFFNEIKIQMDARYEILRGIQNDLKAGKNTDEIFKGLEKIRDQESVRLGAHPTSDEFRRYFRNLFAQDVLGEKDLWGGDKAIENVQLLLSKPWVKLRKL